MIKSQSTFSKFKSPDPTSTPKVAKGVASPSSNFTTKKGGQLPKIQTNLLVSSGGPSSPSLRANKNNFEVSEMLVEPNSPMINMNRSNDKMS
jgi:hypothetical protein